MRWVLLIAAFLFAGTPVMAKCAGPEMCVQYYAARYHVPPQFISALIDVESGWNPRAVSSKQAMGLMQLMPATARRFGAFDPFNVEQNIAAGTPCQVGFPSRVRSELSDTARITSNQRSIKSGRRRSQNTKNEPPVA
jgi:membrane-bound lytic murein transglycosylase MltF